MTTCGTLTSGAGASDTVMGGHVHMRRPALHQHTAHTEGWSHPYTGADRAAVFYNDGGDPPTPAAPAAVSPKPAPPAARVITEAEHQAEVERIAAKEKAQGKRAGAAEALEKFAADHGFSNVEDAKAFIEAARQAKEAALSEQEKREQALAKREAELAAKEAAAVARERIANRRALLAGLGATGDDLDDATALLANQVDDNADEQTINDAANALKARRGELFGTPQQPKPVMPPAPGGSPAGGPPARQAPSGKPGDRGRAIAAARGHGQRPAA